MGRHKEWRKIAKKMRRKRIRTLKAIERDEKMKKEEERRAQSPSYRSWLEEQEQMEKFRQEEEERIYLEQNERWLQNERAAKERWEQQQKKLEHVKAEKVKKELIMKEEWEREQKKLKKEAELRRLEKERKEREQIALLDRIEKYVTGESERLPSSAVTITETQPGLVECPFFAKVAACRFRDSCSRNHIRPSVSKTLLLPGFYSHFRIEHVNRSNEYDTDVGLEYDDREIYQHFLEFYHDVLTEMKSYGTVVQFKVCCNEEPHLRGNVYVQYTSERYAIRAFRALQGRYYGGKQISVEFCNIKAWNRALCGLYSKKKCPKGSRCNFLHVFRNPGNEFHKADRDISDDTPQTTSVRRERSEEWRWSTSPEAVSYHDRLEPDENKYTSSSGCERKNKKHSYRSSARSRSISRDRDAKRKKHKCEISPEKKRKRKKSKRSRNDDSPRKEGNNKDKKKHT